MGGGLAPPVFRVLGIWGAGFFGEEGKRCKGKKRREEATVGEGLGSGSRALNMADSCGGEWEAAAVAAPAPVPGWLSRNWVS